MRGRLLLSCLESRVRGYVVIESDIMFFEVHHAKHTIGHDIHGQEMGPLFIKYFPRSLGFSASGVEVIVMQSIYKVDLN